MSDIYECFAEAAKLAIFFRDPQIRGKALENEIVEYVKAASNKNSQRNLNLFCSRYNKNSGVDITTILFKMFECLPQDELFVASVSKSTLGYNFVVWILGDPAVDFGSFNTIEEFNRFAKSSYF